MANNSNNISIELNELPSNWVVSNFGEIGDYINGRAFKSTEWGAIGRPIVRIQDLTGTGKESNRYDGEIEDKHIVNPGDLLFAWSATLGAYISR